MFAVKFSLSTLARRLIVAQEDPIYFFFLFFFLFTQARPQSQWGELWGCLVAIPPVLEKTNVRRHKTCPSTSPSFCYVQRRLLRSCFGCWFARDAVMTHSSRKMTTVTMIVTSAASGLRSQKRTHGTWQSFYAVGDRGQVNPASSGMEKTLSF